MQLLGLKKYSNSHQLEEKRYYYRSGKLVQEITKKGQQGQEMTYGPSRNVIGKFG